MSFNAIRENKILAKISKSTVPFFFTNEVIDVIMEIIGLVCCVSLVKVDDCFWCGVAGKVVLSVSNSWFGPSIRSGFSVCGNSSPGIWCYWWFGLLLWLRFATYKLFNSALEQLAGAIMFHSACFAWNCSLYQLLILIVSYGVALELVLLVLLGGIINFYGNSS